jgi:hypothetical protein
MTIVKEIIEKFRSKYGNSDVQKYYSKFDVGIEFAHGISFPIVLFII